MWPATKNAQADCCGTLPGPAVVSTRRSLQVGGQAAPEGISQAAVVHCLAQQAEQLGAFKLARMAHTRLQSLRLPPAWQVGHLCICCALPRAVAACQWHCPALELTRQLSQAVRCPATCRGRVIWLQDQSLHPTACAAMQVWQLHSTLLLCRLQSACTTLAGVS